ncbi:PilT/PilU family type 4a pilus ATPase [Thermoactinomyces sp. AMNI-1]|uniref:PilT/PilU family type 4a pilus ATPase n=1 Tax=Thermoactinomyces mirandus TaxID=2756294 RepID=A0A7W1XSZ1_9BACL|nr:PilT/PilU family type 4a pilus ATPase [Thermoactinomyces mirandus]
MLLEEAIHLAAAKNATDLHYIEEEFPYIRVDGKIEVLTGNQRGSRQEIAEFLGIGTEETKEKEAAMSFGRYRIRIHLYQKQKRLALTIRLLPGRIPDSEELQLPPVLKKVIRQAGLFLVTGPTGSGKTTTLASLIQELNRTESLHILTLEDPIEYLHFSDKSLVIQREVGEDINGFAEGMAAALRQGPDVIMIGELRDQKAIQTALHLAETGKLVMATMHAGDVEKAIYRIIDSFSAEEQTLVRSQLAASMLAIVSQKIIRLTCGKRQPAFEVLLNHRSVAHLIRNDQLHQLYTIMQSHQSLGMQTMEMALENLKRAAAHG